MPEVLQLINLSRSFNHATALAGVNLSLARGDRLAVVGPSGSGKTTLLRLIAGIDVPTAGTVIIDGKIVARDGRLLVQPEHRGVAMVFQGLALFPHLRALDQIAFAARDHGAIAHARSLLERIGLGHRASAALDELSGGERQRIALARALAQRPLLLLMDEPFTSIDDPKRAEMRDLLRSLLDGTDTTLILVTHSRDDALDLATRVVVLDAGRPIVSDSLANVLARPNHVAAVQALGLGQIIEGTTNDGATMQSTFGPVAIQPMAAPGGVRLLIRLAQPRIVPPGEGAEATIIAMELRPPEAGEGVRRFAIVRVADKTLRVEMRGSDAGVGQRVCVRIEGSCIPIAG